MFNFFFKLKYPNSLVILRLEFGLVTVVKGKVTRDLIYTLEDITKRTGDRGVMVLSHNEGKLSLEFSETISKRTKQRITYTFPYEKYRFFQ